MNLREIAKRAISLRGLLLRAAGFALAWFFLPFWLFFLIALYLYFVPLFRMRFLDALFFAILVLAYIHPVNFLFAVLLFGLFAYILLIKNLLLIDRKSAYELLVFALTFFLLRDFYGQFNAGISFVAVGWGLLLALLIGVLLNSFMSSQGAVGDKPGMRRISSWLCFLVMWQLIILALFLPLDFIYQSIIVFLLGITILDLVPEYYLGSLTREKIYLTGTTVFAVLVIVLASARWVL
jgi:hypothetical protein